MQTGDDLYRKIDFEDAELMVGRGLVTCVSVLACSLGFGFASKCGLKLLDVCVLMLVVCVSGIGRNFTVCFDMLVQAITWGMHLLMQLLFLCCLLLQIV